MNALHHTTPENNMYLSDIKFGETLAAFGWTQARVDAYITDNRIGRIQAGRIRRGYADQVARG
jgi:hypothetical protein